MKLLTELYSNQASKWPKTGRHILAQFDENSEKAWKQAVKNSDVRLQWDPDYHPSGAKLERRAIQLGLRGDILANYAREWIVNIEDISEFVQQQHQYNTGDRAQLLTPSETVYPVTDPEICQRLGLSTS